MKWRGQWPHRSEHSGIVRCESTALVHAYSRGCLECQRPCYSQGQRPKRRLYLLGFVSRFCYVKMSPFHGLGVILSRNVLRSVICVAKLLDIVGNLCHESVPPQNSKHHHVPFGNDANFVNHSGVAAIKIQQFFQNSSSTLARLARHLSAFTSMCRTDTAGRGALEPLPEGGARTKLYSTENSTSANRILRPRQKTPDQSP